MGWTVTIAISTTRLQIIFTPGISQDELLLLHQEPVTIMLSKYSFLKAESMTLVHI
jgi:hypothetical protein